MHAAARRLRIMPPMPGAFWFPAAAACLNAAGRLPHRARRFVGRRLGELGLLLAGRRRRIVARNLELAFPEWPARRRRQVLLRHFRSLGESFMDIVWSAAAPLAELRRRVRFAGLERLQGGAVILFVPHFVGMNMGTLLLEHRARFYYKPLRNAFWDAYLGRARVRAGDADGAISAARPGALRECVRWLRGGGNLYYLPDIDPGRRRPADTVFAPFLGVRETATLTTLPRLATAAGARVAACVPEMTPDGYCFHIHPPLDNFPGSDLTAAVARVNRIIEKEVRARPEQYYWVHRRFKTAPDGASRYA